MPNCFAFFALLWENQLSSLGHISIKYNFTWPWLKVCGSQFNSVTLMKILTQSTLSSKNLLLNLRQRIAQTTWLLPWEIQEVFIKCVSERLNSNQWHLWKFQEKAINLTFFTPADVNTFHKEELHFEANIKHKEKASVMSFEW